MKKAFGIITTSLLVIVIILAIMLAGVRLVGITPYTVLSGSMEKKIPVGSLIYTVEVNPSTLKEQDVITYVIEGGTVVTHRIIELLPDEEDPTLVRFRTKGDNNDIPDGDPVHPKNILGKVIFTVPLLGYIAWFVQNPPGSYITIGIGVILVLLTFLPELLDKLEEKEAKKVTEVVEEAAEASVNETLSVSEDDAPKQDVSDTSSSASDESPHIDVSDKNDGDQV